jgi:N-methylhydantoinase A/oxoprolinase/acetone carboxylase beta subunit
MNDDYAARSPVETIHSGPAASAIGGKFLSGLEQALVLDVGGTTTDLALIQDGKVTISETGASVAGYKTSVQAANLLSIGLGGDSQITLDRSNQLSIGPNRVVPLAYLSNQNPHIRERLDGLANQGWPAPGPRELEYWFLQRDVQDRSNSTSREQDVIDLLSAGAKPASQVLKDLGLLDPNQINIDNLWREEVIGIAGFTPTDLLHVDGRHTPWDRDASRAALQVFSNYLNLPADNLQRKIWDLITEIITKAVLQFLTEKDIPDKNDPQHKLANWFLNNTLQPKHDQLNTQIQLKVPLIGIGAPAEIILDETARVLNADLVLPDHFQVANAAGAVAGSVMVIEKVLIYPHLSTGNVDVIGYYIQAREVRDEYEELEDALAAAKKIGHENALSAALRAGADNPQVIVDVTQDGIDTYLVEARAVGKPRLES